MPDYWYNRHRVRHSSDDEHTRELNRRIVAYRKPYFMIYIYPQLKKKYKQFVEGIRGKSILTYGKKFNELADILDFKKNVEYYAPVGRNNCVTNRIAYLFEKEFSGYSAKENAVEFDYSILKSGSDYSKADYQKIALLYKDYLKKVDNFHHKSRFKAIDSFDLKVERKRFLDDFRVSCEKVCTNEDELCDIVLDICYTNEKSKDFAWEICGKKIIENLLNRNGNKLHFPEKALDDAEFEYAGKYFKMTEYEVKEEEIDDCDERNGVCAGLYQEEEDVE